MKYYKIEQVNNSSYLLKYQNAEIAQIVFEKHGIRLFNNGTNILYGFFEYRKIISFVADKYMRLWREKQNSKVIHRSSIWKGKIVRKTFSKLLHPIWKSELSRANQLIVSVQRSIFHSIQSCPHFVLLDSFYDNKYYIYDILKYPVASKLLKRIYSCDSIGNFIGFEIDVEDGSTTIISPDQWIHAFSANKHVSRSLAKTIQSIKYSIPNGTLETFRKLDLTQPITERWKLLAILAYYELRGGANIKHFQDVIYNTQFKDFKRSLQLVAEQHGFINRSRVIRHYISLLSTIRYITDCGYYNYGSFLSLTRHSIEWHRQFRPNARLFINSYEPETKVAMPSFELPRYKGVTFLDTVKVIQEESLKMEHCVSSYIADAIAGKHFLFHIEYNGEMATAQLDLQGNVCQIQGPRNKPNAACTWGKRFFNKQKNCC